MHWASAADASDGRFFGLTGGSLVIDRGSMTIVHDGHVTLPWFVLLLKLTSDERTGVG